jgi:hypothetical protein
MDLSDFSGDEEFFQLDFNKIYENNTVSSITKTLAFTIQQCGYYSIGDFFKGLSDDDLSTLNDWFESRDCEEEILLLVLLLSKGESTECSDLDMLVDRFTKLGIFATSESLYRNGYVDLFHDKLSFGEDMIDEVFVRSKND